MINWYMVLFLSAATFSTLLPFAAPPAIPRRTVWGGALLGDVVALVALVMALA